MTDKYHQITIMEALEEIERVKEAQDNRAKGEIGYIQNVLNFEDSVMPFGKYKGKYIAAVADEHFDYLVWTLKTFGEQHTYIWDLIFAHLVKALEKYPDFEQRYIKLKEELKGGRYGK